ncbi:uncharacterized protein KD926_005193 [Aspergillus affinis]|uniref:uncharacterized protein n=1 Tax=Aspergillus affinis TaxID=1070780 RepID=UPI0022FF29D2|nr:uncharacterized protein KD926_005193 [Aspergillus affinis]KAI9034858.1 hypothetical protein KD926_005193 [Aspergillus affinis]
MANPQNEALIREIEAAVIIWRPSTRVALAFTSEDVDPTVNVGSQGLANESDYAVSFAQNTIDQVVDTTRDNLEAIISGEAGAEIFADDAGSTDVLITEQSAEEEPREDQSEPEAAEGGINHAQGQRDSPPGPPASEGGLGDDSGDDDSSSDDTTALPERVRTGEFKKHVTNLGPNDRPSTPVLLRFKAPAQQETMAFDVDRYDCDTLNVELRKYNGATTRYDQEVRDIIPSVDVDVTGLGYVEEIKTVGVYLSKAGDVAGLIMSYIFDDDETAAF